MKVAHLPAAILCLLTLTVGLGAADLAKVRAEYQALSWNDKAIHLLKCWMAKVPSSHFGQMDMVSRGVARRLRPEGIWLGWDEEKTQAVIDKKTVKVTLVTNWKVKRPMWDNRPDFVGTTTVNWNLNEDETVSVKIIDSAGDLSEQVRGVMADYFSKTIDKSFRDHVAEYISKDDGLDAQIISGTFPAAWDGAAALICQSMVIMDRKSSATNYWSLLGLKPEQGEKIDYVKASTIDGLVEFTVHMSHLTNTGDVSDFDLTFSFTRSAFNSVKISDEWQKKNAVNLNALESWFKGTMFIELKKQMLDLKKKGQLSFPDQ